MCQTTMLSNVSTLIGYFQKSLKLMEDNNSFTVKYSGLVHQKVFFKGNRKSFVWDTTKLVLLEKKSRIMGAKLRNIGKCKHLQIFDHDIFIGDLYKINSLFKSKYIADFGKLKIFAHKSSRGIRFYAGNKKENGIKIAIYEICGLLKQTRQLKVEQDIDPCIIMVILVGVEHLMSLNYEII
eukprot:NODE_398_length_8105_cov_1.375094.p8 type:complete len:181 gc:universal NODE_398_length_8105_cov_1.375094:5383-4841(-)